MSAAQDAEPRLEAGEDVVWLPVAELRLEGSPRAMGEDEEHIRTLAVVEAQFPPILVHRSTMRVIDGAHRVRAARLAAREFITARYFDGSPEDAFVLAVRANIGHGLPLSLKDRITAAERIVATHPAWSDRMIAGTTGIAPRTVAEIRARIGGAGRSEVRIGRDGRARPVDGERRRSLAVTLLTENPEMSLRQVAQMAGVSPETVRRVRNRLLYGRRSAPAPTPPTTAARDRGTCADAGGILRKLTLDPALRQSDTGRAMLRLLHAQMVPGDEWERILAHLPAHCAELVEQVAREFSRQWSDVAARVAERSSTTG